MLRRPAEIVPRLRDALLAQDTARRRGQHIEITGERLGQRDLQVLLIKHANARKGVGRARHHLRGAADQIREIRLAAVRQRQHPVIEKDPFVFFPPDVRAVHRNFKAMDAKSFFHVLLLFPLRDERSLGSQLQHPRDFRGRVFDVIGISDDDRGNGGVFEVDL